MEGLLFSARTLDTFVLAWPIFLNLMICFTLVQSDFLLLLAASFWRAAANPGGHFDRSAAASARRRW